MARRGQEVGESQEIHKDFHTATVHHFLLSFFWEIYLALTFYILKNINKETESGVTSLVWKLTSEFSLICFYGHLLVFIWISVSHLPYKNATSTCDLFLGVWNSDTKLCANMWKNVNVKGNNVGGKYTFLMNLNSHIWSKKCGWYSVMWKRHESVYISSDVT